MDHSLQSNHTVFKSSLRMNKSQCLTEAGLRVGVDILVFTPLYHTFENGHEAFKAFLSQGQFLEMEQEMLSKCLFKTI